MYWGDIGRKDEILLFATTWMDLESIVGAKSDRQKKNRVASPPGQDAQTERQKLVQWVPQGPKAARHRLPVGVHPCSPEDVGKTGLGRESWGRFPEHEAVCGWGRWGGRGATTCQAVGWHRLVTPPDRSVLDAAIGTERGFKPK